VGVLVRVLERFFPTLDLKRCVLLVMNRTLSFETKRAAEERVRETSVNRRAHFCNELEGSRLRLYRAPGDQGHPARHDEAASHLLCAGIPEPVADLLMERILRADPPRRHGGAQSVELLFVILDQPRRLEAHALAVEIDLLVDSGFIRSDISSLRSFPNSLETAKGPNSLGMRLPSRVINSASSSFATYTRHGRPEIPVAVLSASASNCPRRSLSAAEWRTYLSRRYLTCLFVFALLASPATADNLSLEEAQTLAGAGDRSEDDRAKDARRKPAELLHFAQISPSDQVADIGAGSGYTTELLARAVGEKGKVYGHNTPRTVEKYVSESWPARLEKPVNQNVIRVDAEFASPLPAAATELDLITIIFFYHDAVLYGVSGRELARKFYAALRPGGAVILVDHAAKPGSPLKETADSLHRIDEAIVKADFGAAGFELGGTADFMRNPDDPMTEAFYKQEQPTDAFVHRWVKPETAQP
jgi:predicted methyltransferase